MSAGRHHRVSVTALADFACRQGDLESEAVAGPTARQGIRAHQTVQKQAQADGAALGVPIDAELRLTRTVSIEGHTIEIAGRLDLVDRSIPRLSEIKTTLVPADRLSESKIALQWAQLSLYAFLYLPHHADALTAESDEPLSMQTATPDVTQQPSDAGPGHGLPATVELELIHVNLRADRVERQCRRITPAAIESQALSAIGIWFDWQRRRDRLKDRMCETALALGFPHAAFRQGQRELSAAVYCTARDRKTLMCEAPTGTGKTISTLFPAVKAMGEGRLSQVSYLTAKVAGRQSALLAMQRMQAEGLQISAVQIRAKQTTCFCSNGRCERDENGRCPMTLGFFDRLPAARVEAIEQGVLDDALVDEIAWQHQLCPFEFALQLLPWVDVVIADYNYVFDPLVRLQHYSEARRQDLLLIDETHNLLDRSRAMYSARLDRLACLAAAAECRQHHPRLAQTMDRLAERLLSVVKQGSAEQRHGSVSVSVVQDNDPRLAKRAAEAIEAILEARDKPPVLPDSVDELFRALCRFVVISELYGEQHRRIDRSWHQGRRRQVVLTLFCLDAASALQRQYRQFGAIVLFSATLRPARFYRDTLGLPEETRFLPLPSPFDPVRALYCLVDWIDTRYRRRGESMSALVTLVHDSCALRSGNYLIFLPSYSYLEQAHAAFVSAHPDIDVWRQYPGESAQVQQQRLRQMDEPGHRIGFAIIGGVYGEGVDYHGDRLIGVIVVGPGLPGLEEESRLIAEHHEQRGYDGFDMAYRYPGLTRVLQTVGRLIRSEEDAGFALLVDPRFGSAFYRQLYPEHWQMAHPANLQDLHARIGHLWQRVARPT